MEFEEVPFTKLLSDIIDNRGKTCPTAKTGLPLIATNCIRNDLLYPTYDTVRYVSPETCKTWFRGHPQPGDLLFVTKGTPGRVCAVPDPVDFCIAQDMVAVRADSSRVYPKYLFAALRSARIQNNIEKLHVGSMIPHFKKGDFDELSIPLPDRTAQQFIGDCYFDLSAKIELNRRMNQTLEALARALFENFFPHNPDDELPAGWCDGTIKELAVSIQYGLTQSATTEPVGPRFLRITDIQGGRVDWGTVPFCRVSEEEYQRYRLQPGDVLVARTGASTGENLFLSESPDAVFASYLVRFQFPDLATARYVGMFMRSQRYFDYIAGNLGGSAQPNASAQVLASAEIVVPPTDELSRFLNLVTPFDKTIAANNRESSTLAALRDALLPKLLSGELRVPAAEKFAEAAA